MSKITKWNNKKKQNNVFFCFSSSYVWQTKLASTLVNFWAHYKIVCLIDLLRSIYEKTKTLNTTSE